MSTQARWYARHASSPMTANYGPFEVVYEIIDPPIRYGGSGPGIYFPSSFAGGIYIGYQSLMEAEADIPRLQANLESRNIPADTWE